MAESTKQDTKEVVKETRETAKDTVANTSSGLDENIAGALSYIWVIALLFLFTEKKSTFVRFHAVQGLLTSLLYGLTWWFGFNLAGLLNFIVTLILAYGAYQAFSGEKYKFPVVGDVAEKQSHNLPA